MSELSDSELIERYHRAGAESAFAAIVDRYVDLVYSTALRVLRNKGLAEDVTQQVFIALARNARELSRRPVLSGWLHKTARNFAVMTVRREERRRRRELEATSVDSTNSTDADTDWHRITAHLDEALAQLCEADRQAILLKFFERKTAREIGEQLGFGEEAAQKRAVRALDRLRAIVAKRGIAMPAVEFASLLAAEAVQSAPAGLTASVIASVATAGAAIPLTSTVGLLMVSTKSKIAAAAVLLAGVSTPIVIQHQTHARLRGEIVVLQRQNADLQQLRDKNQRLAALAADAPESEQQLRERSELMRLRSEVGFLRAQVSEAIGARGDGMTAVEPPAHTTSHPPSVPSTGWANVGFGTPRDALQTMNWAKANRDTNTILNGLAWADEETRASLEALFAAASDPIRAQYGSADGFIINQVENPRFRDGSIVSHRVVSETIEDDLALLDVEWEFPAGQTKTEPVQLVRIGDGWRESFEVNDRVLARFAALLQVEELAFEELKRTP